MNKKKSRSRKFGARPLKDCVKDQGPWYPFCSAITGLWRHPSNCKGCPSRQVCDRQAAAQGPKGFTILFIKGALPRG